MTQKRISFEWQVDVTQVNEEVKYFDFPGEYLSEAGGTFDNSYFDNYDFFRLV
jgi:hypothetical protein